MTGRLCLIYCFSQCSGWKATFTKVPADIMNVTEAGLSESCTAPFIQYQLRRLCLTSGLSSQNNLNRFFLIGSEVRV